MGCAAIATCPCGYDSGELLIGQGMTGPDPCYFPAYCREGGHIVDVNMCDDPRHCPEGHSSEPIPYNSETLIKHVGAKIVVGWGSLDGDKQLKLTDGSYFCPACHQYTLAFSEGGTMWD